MINDVQYDHRALVLLEPLCFSSSCSLSPDDDGKVVDRANFHDMQVHHIVTPHIAAYLGAFDLW
jgi:hypothetical protein